MTGDQTAGQRAEVAWTARRVPVSTRFDDPYFSLEDGLAETRHTFLAGNDLPARFTPGFHVAELGFGTGLNMLATCLAFEAAGAPGPLHYTSFEAYPMTADDMARALAAFAQTAAVADGVIGPWSRGERQFSLGAMRVEVIEGDARTTLPRWAGRADAWYLDGFSPAKNPALWEPELLAAVGTHTAPGGTFATYTAAGFVRRALEDAGFAVARRPGFGRKRHMSVGCRP